MSCYRSSTPGGQNMASIPGLRRRPGHRVGWTLPVSSNSYRNTTTAEPPAIPPNAAAVRRSAGVMAANFSKSQAASMTIVERRAADVAVLGDSCVAFAAAYSLARRGKKVILLPDLGLSGEGVSWSPPSGVHRPLHLPHPDAAMVSLTSESAAYWRGLQAQAGGSGLRLLTDCRSLDLGLLRGTGGGEAGEVLGQLQEACKAAGARLGSLRPEELSALLPPLRLPGGAAGLLQPEGGVLDSRAAQQLLLNLGERQGVLLRARLVLRGWRDAGSYFVVRASGCLAPEAISLFEVEQLLVAPAEGAGWPGQVLRLFGAEAALQAVHSSSARCAATAELTCLPVWRAIGLRLPSTAGAATSGSGSGRGSEVAGAPAPMTSEQQLLLPVVNGFPARLSAPGSSSSVSLRMGLGLRGATATTTAAGGETDRGLDPWVKQAVAPDRSGLLFAHRLTGKLLRGIGPLLLPPQPPAEPDAAAPSSASVSPEAQFGDVALHTATPDGWPVLGFLPGIEPGRLLFACTASYGTGRVGGGGGGSSGGAWGSSSSPTYTAVAGGPPPPAPSPTIDTSSKSGTLRSARDRLPNQQQQPQQQPQQPQVEPQQLSPPSWLLGGRPVLHDGYQLSPLVAKMAVDLLCGAARPAEVDPDRIDLGRPALAACSAAEGLDPWDGLGRWQDGTAFREAVEAEADSAEAKERAEARARGARMLGGDVGVEEEAAREAEDRRRGPGFKVFLP